MEQGLKTPTFLRGRGSGDQNSLVYVQMSRFAVRGKMLNAINALCSVCEIVLDFVFQEALRKNET